MAVWQSLTVGTRNEGGKVPRGSVADFPAPQLDCFVAAPLTDKEQKKMQRSISRGVPFGDENLGNENGATPRPGIDATRSREAKESALIPITVPDTFSHPPFPTFSPPHLFPSGVRVPWKIRGLVTDLD